MTFALGTLSGAIVRLVWLLAIAAYAEEMAARRTYQLDSLPRAHLVR